MARILIGNIKGPQGPQGKQGIQGPIGPAGPQGPLPPLVNNYLTTEAGTAAADAAILPDIDNRIKGINSDLDSKISNDTSYSHVIALGFDETERTNIRIDNTIRTLPVNSSINYDIVFMEMTINPDSQKRALKLTWQADGKMYNSYIETDSSDI